MIDITNILIVGVGGQGTILASRVMAGAVQMTGQDVKVSEIHGMAQRGGSVVTQVRYGKEVASPIIPEGEADIILAFEKLEALRWLPYLKKDGSILINDQRIDPMPVVVGAAQYPSDVLDIIEKERKEVFIINGLEKAVEAGNAKAVNVVLLGLLARCLKIDKQIWLDVIRETVPSKLLAVNLKAFEAGWNGYLS
ncbi:MULTISPECIES: indolepyruvate oxidoreductase subunit beta [Dehalobacter]|jgi:indolepyruvate ferredoxin oxidoreductase beta subunit|uniref:Indolepyruvate oxidoreductase subunit beta n=2 Tax=Dehalobacter restrictus TaxID=55583 RepID=A0A857DF87_9FIRM|nr:MULTISPECIES: indolepyruvate oxidoreductase subunit beta [Dehalobacter]AHF08863.1 indolepyruvate oxidoreductase [Dehalobacter restrictus DSM 9455]MCG1025741.1 indolepyruvate oxidoreductase subunit beta [Dehalobacter sp.]MDJ0305445.1 indolepyruvate oxidoreductase subunit beta [Dehalobacter sp.]OCZ50039.1 indolepyruvate oxidoreductase subunit beta [Dehalobacter sp. TeCB1]QGZ99360.1 indolepyruvate oxidoreductase subunit beta [Dehalobacter restrictus]